MAAPALVVALALPLAAAPQRAQPPAPAREQQPAGGPRPAPQQPAAAQPVQQPALPDLRIVQLEVTPSPLPDGTTAHLRVMLHNRSSVAAAGSIVVEVVHDRATPQPLPQQVEVVYLRADGLAEVAFEVPRATLRASPYTFFAAVDAGNAIPEADEHNNTAWRRIEVCGAADAAEETDGFDNDCDGAIDEDLGQPPDTGAALAMLRVLQRRARRDAAPLLFALPRLFAPAPVRHAVRLVSEEGGFVGRVTVLARPVSPAADAPPVELSAGLLDADPGSRLSLIDWNGGELRSGDLVSLGLTAAGAGGPAKETVVALGGGGGRVLARSSFRPGEALFTLIKQGAAQGALIAGGDPVALAAATGQFVSAEQGGGGPLRADRAAVAGWETFTLEMQVPH